MAKPLKKNWFQVHKKITIALGVYFISLFVPILGMFTQFPLYIIKCGGLPLSTIEKGIYKVYKKPGDPVYGPAYLPSRYFCTESEAQSAGYEYN